MMQFEQNDKLLETSAIPEVQQSAGEANGVPQMAKPRFFKPNGTTAESAQLATQPTVNPNGSAGPTDMQNNLGGGIFDPARWKTPADARLDPNAKIKPAAFSKVEVRKPPQDHYVHAHSDPAFNGVFPLYADSESKRYDPNLIAPDLVDSLPPQVKVNVKFVRLAVAVTDTGRLFLWYVLQTGSDWHESGDACILTAMKQWVKVIPDGGGYRLEYPQVSLPEPSFPDWSFGEYLARAFKDRYVGSFDHPVIKRLAGIR